MSVAVFLLIKIPPTVSTGFQVNGISLFVFYKLLGKLNTDIGLSTRYRILV